MKPFISFCLLLCICLGKLYAQGVNIVYIGNSITQGALLKTPVTEAPPVQARKGTLLFSIMLGTNDSACNGPFGSPVEPVSYYTNMKAIIDELLSLYPECKVVIHQPIWYSPNTYNGAMYLAAGLKRLKSYTPMIHKLVDYYSQANPNQVFLGDTAASDFFRNNYQSYFTPENGNAGTFYLHPNKEGAGILGKYWAEAILKAI